MRPLHVRVFALFMSFVFALSGINTQALAEAMESGRAASRKTVTAFEQLADDVKRQEVESGKGEDVVKLPATIRATVMTGTQSKDAQKPAEQQPVTADEPGPADAAAAGAVAVTEQPAATEEAQPVEQPAATEQQSPQQPTVNNGQQTGQQGTGTEEMQSESLAPQAQNQTQNQTQSDTKATTEAPLSAVSAAASFIGGLFAPRKAFAAESATGTAATGTTSRSCVPPRSTAWS